MVSLSGSRMLKFVVHVIDNNSYIKNESLSGRNATTSLYKYVSMINVKLVHIDFKDLYTNVHLCYCAAIPKASAIQSSPLIITSIQTMTDIAVNKQRLSYLLS